ncbi:MAG: metal-binding protein [Halobacteriales archaeon SW_9_67_25]|nr:MAG: metal-binding protein [Halobacteriales archaeon SW_9_67_25]
MKKQELIHFHTLLAEVTTYCQEQGLTLDLSSYHDQDIHPMAISEAKSDHETAVLALAGGVADSLDRSGEDSESVRASADRPQSSA